MNRIMVTVLVSSMIFIITGKSFAGDCRSRFSLPIQLSGEGEFFVSDATIRAMEGDPTKPITWTGDENSWGQTSVENYVYHATSDAPAVTGVLVKGVGDNYNRWNLYQKSYRRGYLRIEKAFPFPCQRVYKVGDLDPDGYDHEGLGPAFWGSSELTISEPD